MKSENTTAAGGQPSRRLVWLAYQWDGETGTATRHVGYLVTDRGRVPAPIAFVHGEKLELALQIADRLAEPAQPKAFDLRGIGDGSPTPPPSFVTSMAFQPCDRAGRAVCAGRPVCDGTWAGFMYVHMIGGGGDRHWLNVMFWARWASPFLNEESGSPTCPVTPRKLGSNGSDEADAPTAA